MLLKVDWQQITSLVLVALAALVIIRAATRSNLNSCWSDCIGAKPPGTPRVALRNSRSANLRERRFFPTIH